MCASAPALRVVFREYLSEPLSKIKRSVTSHRSRRDSDVEHVIIRRIDSPSEVERHDFHAKHTPTCSFSSGGVTAIGVEDHGDSILSSGKAWDGRQDSVQHTNPPLVKTPADYESYNLQNMEKYRQSAQRHGSRGQSMGEGHEMSSLSGRSWLRSSGS